MTEQRMLRGMAVDGPYKGYRLHHTEPRLQLWVLDQVEPYDPAVITAEEWFNKPAPVRVVTYAYEPRVYSTRDEWGLKQTRDAGGVWKIEVENGQS